MTTKTGANYEDTKDLDIAEIAKRIRRDLRTDERTSAHKWGVRISRYSMGQSVDVTLKTLDPNESVAACVDFEAPGALERPVSSLLRGSLKTAMEAALEIVDSYNRREVDLMTDYWNVHFHRQVQMAHEIKDALRMAQVESIERTAALGC